jgi:roadblock/LC7 domain-containing protein
LQGDHKPIPLMRTEFNESAGQFAPDGHLIAYTSDESGGDEPSGRSTASAVSAGGATPHVNWRCTMAIRC